MKQSWRTQSKRSRLSVEPVPLILLISNFKKTYKVQFGFLLPGFVNRLIYSALSVVQEITYYKIVSKSIVA